MSFKDLTIKRTYTAEKDDILNEFYIPVLKQARIYKRITGYFSSTALSVCASGLSEFISNRGKMQFILNVHLSKEDSDSIATGIKNPDQVIESLLLDDIDNIESELKTNYTKMLGWLIANEYLEIKVGFILEQKTKNDILHQKVGIMVDEEDNIITFCGSNNESASGWAFHSEKFKVFMSWKDEIKEYVKDDLMDFDDLWFQRSKKTEVINFPDALKMKLIRMAPKSKEELNTIIAELKLKESLNKKEVKLREYQHEAIKSWINEDYKGIFEMATGTGKTMTALGALKELFKKEEKLVVIISCPFLHLVNQWEDALEKMNIQLPTVLASSMDSKWSEKIDEKILKIKLSRLDKFIILTTHDTISSKKFISLIEEIDVPICMIGDEVHGMGSSERMDGLLDKYEYRLGLSATPNRYFDDEGTQVLMNFFKKTVYSFNLERALTEKNPDTGKTYLTPYEYHPIFVDLEIDEFDEYVKLTRKIIINQTNQNKSEKEKVSLKFLLLKRQEIIKNAVNKYGAFSDLMTKLKNDIKVSHTLVYCSPQQIDILQKKLNEIGNIIHHKFTSDENAIKKEDKYDGLTQREFLLKNFDEGVYDVLVAIKCLDEGVDVPSTQTAILMSNTGNPKEWIQRRGRVLRRFPGKDKAIIYDLIVIPDIKESEITKYDKKIVESQFERIEEFVKLSLNYSEISRKLYKVKEKYNMWE